MLATRSLRRRLAKSHRLGLVTVLKIAMPILAVVAASAGASPKVQATNASVSAPS